MHRGAAAYDRVIPYRHLAAEGHPLGEHRPLPYLAIVPDMAMRHYIRFVAYERAAPAQRGPRVDIGELPYHDIPAYRHAPTFAFGEFQIVRKASYDAELVDDRARADRCFPLDYHILAQGGPVAYGHARAYDAPVAYFHAAAYPRAVMHDRGFRNPRTARAQDVQIYKLFASRRIHKSAFYHIICGFQQRKCYKMLKPALFP
jgi:hypothetical protein